MIETNTKNINDFLLGKIIEDLDLKYSRDMELPDGYSYGYYKDEILFVAFNRRDLFLTDAFLESLSKENKDFLLFENLKRPIKVKDHQKFKTIGDVILNDSYIYINEPSNLSQKKVAETLMHFDEVVFNDLMKEHHCFNINELKTGSRKDALKLLGLSPIVISLTKYESPYSENTLYSLYPKFVIAKKEDLKNILNNNMHDSFHGIFLDKEFLSYDYNNVTYVSRSEIMNQGDGYTDCTLPSDGSVYFEHVLLKYENLYLVCSLSVWFNK